MNEKIKLVYILSFTLCMAVCCQSVKDLDAWDNKYENKPEEWAEIHPVFSPVNEKIAAAGIDSSVTVSEELVNGIVVKTIRYERSYDVDGFEISEKRYDPKGQIERSYQYTYSAPGKKSSEIIFDHLGDTMYSVEFMYDTNFSIAVYIPNLNSTTIHRAEKPHYQKTYYNIQGKDSLYLIDIGYGYKKTGGRDYDEQGQQTRFYTYWSDETIASNQKPDFYYSGECVVYYYGGQKKKIITTACPNQTERVYKFYSNACYNAAGIIVRQYKGGYLRVTYNVHNLMSLREYFDNLGNLVARITTTYRN